MYSKLLLSFMNYKLLDVSALKLYLLGTDEFHLQWGRTYAPVEVYHITVVNQDGEILQSMRRSLSTSSEELHYSYTSEQSRSEMPECTKLVFTVTAVANGTSSQGEKVSWSGPKKG